MEKVLLLALDNYGSTFVEPKVELGARFGHLVCEWRLQSRSRIPVADSTVPFSRYSTVPGHLSGDAGTCHGAPEPKANGRYAAGVV